MKTFNYKTLTIMLIALLTFSFSSYATNLATNATATASNEHQAAANAIDGNEGTRWETTAADPQWLAVTLDAVYTIDNIKISWEGASAKSYTVKVSTDSATWTEVYSMTDGSGARWDDISFSATDAKYIVMDGTERSTVWGYSIYELQVFETIPDASNATLSDIKVDNVTITDFSANTKEYTYLVDDAMVPTVTATTTVVGATTNIIDATTIPGTTSIVVTATDGITKDTTLVHFKDPIAFPLDFESDPTAYQWEDFGAPTGVIANPQISGINMSSQVAQVIKNAGADWAGSFVTIDSPFTLNADKSVSAKFYSPRSGINMMMKLEDAAGYATAEIQVATTVANEWEILTFAFPNADISKDYNKIVIICDRQTVGDGTAAHTYLVDDIKLYEADPAKDATLSDLKVSGVTIDNFESSKIDYNYSVLSSDSVPTTTYTTTEGGATAVVTDAASIPGTTTIVVESSDGSVEKTYSINFTLNTDCSGTSTEAIEGEFTDGFTYDFVTSGTDVTLTFKLLDDKVGIVAYLHNVTDGFQEISMGGNNTDGYTHTFIDMATDSVISFRCKFAFAGGLAVTKTFSYTTGENCLGTATYISTQSLESLNLYPNPTTGLLNIDAADGTLVQVYNVTGQLQKQENLQGGQLSIADLEQGVYFVNANKQISRVIKK